MKNILSFINKPITGKEIKKWIKENQTSRIARSMKRYSNLVDDRMYDIDIRPNGTGCGERKRFKPNIVKHKTNKEK